MDLNLLLETPPWDWPKGARNTFLSVLKNRLAPPSDRLIAAELAGDFTAINDDLAHALMAVLRDSSEPEELRARAAIAFGAALDVANTEFEEELQGFDDEEMVPLSVETFLEIRELLQGLYADANIPKLVRRRILEAAVRAPQPWQQNAIREAYASGDREWVLTAVFAMRFVEGFESEILEALNNSDPEIHREAVLAAGEEELDAAWPHVSKLAKDDRTEKGLRIAAIGAIGSIRPEEARDILFELSESEDEDIAEAADEALSMMLPDDYEDDEDDEDDEE